VIALVFSALVAIYLLVPNALFRFCLGLFLPIRAFQGVKAEEITRAVVTLIVLFAVALSMVWYVPGCKSHPWEFPDTVQQRAADYAIVAGGLYSEALFKEYGQNFWPPFWRTLERQARFVVWYYLVVTLVAVGLGLLSRYYGHLRRNRFFSWFADVYLLPQITQWHAILTGFTFPGKTTVKADVLMTDDTLYSGEVADYFLGNDGSLGGLFLRNPRRFDRPRYLKEQADWGTTRPREKYWRNIPSAKLYLIGSHIVNLNLNYEPRTATTDVLKKYIDDFLKSAHGAGVGRITIQAGGSTGEKSPFRSVTSGQNMLRPGL
jgi:hypothetical protein